MKHLTQRAGLLVVAIMAALLSSSVQAEKKKVIWTPKWGKSEVAMMSPNVSGKSTSSFNGSGEIR